MPCSPIANTKSKSLFTGSAERNLLLLPAASQDLAGPSLANGIVSRQGRNLTAPRVKYSTRAASFLQSYLLVPVESASAALTEFKQVANGGTVTLDMSGGFGTKRASVIR